MSNLNDKDCKLYGNQLRYEVVESDYKNTINEIKERLERLEHEQDVTMNVIHQLIEQLTSIFTAILEKLE